MIIDSDTQGFITNEAVLPSLFTIFGCCSCVHPLNTKVKWEEYMWSKEATVSQMPVGLWQYPQDTKKGMGEPYVPILRLEQMPK